MKTVPTASLFAALLLVACSEGDRTYSIEEIHAERAPEIPGGVGRSDLHRLGLERTLAPNSHGADPHGGNPPGGATQPRGPTFSWDLPDGWRELPPREFRDANFTLERDPSVECYLTVMPGGGGGLASNVNRWRGQMKLGELSPQELRELPQVMMFGRDATFVELTGTFIGRGGAPKDDSGFLAIYVELPGASLTLKMTGPAAVVAQEKNNFMQVARSLRLDEAHGDAAQEGPADGGTDGGAQPGPAGANDGIAAGMATGSSGFTWETPAGWTKAPDRMMRVVTLHPEGNKDAQCYVAMMGGDGGGLDSNVNRWLDQVGASAMRPAEIAQLPTVAMLGAKGVLIEASGNYTGMGGDANEGSGLLGIVCMLEGQAVFVKFIGPADLVKREKDNFLAFSRSLRTEK